MFSNTTSSPFHNSASADWTANSAQLTSAIVIAVLSPIAVAGNALILVAIWKKTFAPTPFHIILSGLAFTDLCTGLIAQPFSAAATLTKVANPTVQYTRSLLYITLDTIGDSSAIYFISLTVLLITLMSIERWLHMSRRSLVTSRRGCFIVFNMLLIPILTVVCRVLSNENETYRRYIYVMTITLMLSCYLTTSFAYFKVYRIIHHHQQQVKANETSQNFGRKAIDLAKYKKSVASMLYFVALFSFCFIPFIVFSGLYIGIPNSFEVAVANRVSKVLLFLSSSLNPGLYVWRMNDIRNGVKKLFCN
ncbi:uncharacterized protein LOC144630911 [Oculina patagonica]